MCPIKWYLSQQILRGYVLVIDIIYSSDRDIVKQRPVVICGCSRFYLFSLKSGWPHLFDFSQLVGLHSGLIFVICSNVASLETMVGINIILFFFFFLIYLSLPCRSVNIRLAHSSSAVTAQWELLQPREFAGWWELPSYVSLRFLIFSKKKSVDNMIEVCPWAILLCSILTCRVILRSLVLCRSLFGHLKRMSFKLDLQSDSTFLLEARKSENCKKVVNLTFYKFTLLYVKWYRKAWNCWWRKRHGLKVTGSIYWMPATAFNLH